MITIDRLRVPSDADVERINALVAELKQERWTVTKGELQEILRNDLFVLLVARDGENIVGLRYSIFARGLGRWHCWIYDMVVDRAYRGTGISAMLANAGIASVQEFADEQGVPIQPYYTTNPSRKESNGLSRKIGYTLIAEAVGPMGTNLYKTVMHPKKK